jgi:hypothetical protein
VRERATARSSASARRNNEEKEGGETAEKEGGRRAEGARERGSSLARRAHTPSPRHKATRSSRLKTKTCLALSASCAHDVIPLTIPHTILLYAPRLVDRGEAAVTGSTGSTQQAPRDVPTIKHTSCVAYDLSIIKETCFRDRLRKSEEED